MSGSAYARLVPKLHRSRKLPKIDRPWRPRMIAWAGPTAFYPNRFYEIDKWYKARIDKPEKVPKFHIIDPANHQLSLAELLKKERPEPINIGFKLQDGTIMPKNTKNGVDLEKKARNMELLVDLSDIGDSPSRNICCHYNIFDDLFGKGVFFENVQKLDIAFGHNAVYYGNIISAETTSTIPKVSIESIKSGGLNTLIMVNIDGNPYDEVGEIAQWIVANIPDGYGIENGDQILPYMQPLPFCGTGYHRISFILFRHEKPITNFHKLDG